MFNFALFFKKANMSKINTMILNLAELNDKQKEAVVSEEKRLLVLAGAGSGKTKTLLQKLIYLIDTKGVQASQIMAVTFTRNAANEMIDRLIMSADTSGEYKERISDKKLTINEKQRLRRQYSLRYTWINKLTIKTFHSFCYSLLKNYGANEFDNQFRMLGDNANVAGHYPNTMAPESFFNIIHKMLISCCSEIDYLLKLKRYILDYYVDEKHFREIGHDGVIHGGLYYTTLKGDKVRSKSERDIADWFFRRGIKYRYEPDINFKDFDFKPDFFLPDADLYIEHVSGKSYPTERKEEQFEVSGKLLVKTYEHTMKNSNLINIALERIVKGRLSSSYTANNAVTFEEEFRTYHEQIKDFLRQALRVIDMVKVENLNFEAIYQNSQTDQHERVREFYALIYPLFTKYDMYCINKSYLDFNDLIIRTINVLKKQEDIKDVFQSKYKYILVDEFQDVNNLQVDLLKHLLSPESSLFCVGDDWQSIYGFRGSEIDYIINFEKYFNNAKIIKLNLNYRSNDTIVEASNEVIRKNKHQIDKDITAWKKSKSKIHIYPAKCNEDAIEYVVKEIRKFIKQGYEPNDLLILYRRNKMFQPFSSALRKHGLQIPGRTIHSAKGLEARIVFILGLTEGFGGFPDIWMDDRILQVVKKVKHTRMLEEERRLFYVALTRAKDELFLITELGNESSFIKEIPEDFAIKYSVELNPIISTENNCPNCFAELNQNFQFCPYCGQKIDNKQLPDL